MPTTCRPSLQHCVPTSSNLADHTALVPSYGGLATDFVVCWNAAQQRGATTQGLGLNTADFSRRMLQGMFLSKSGHSSAFATFMMQTAS